MSGHNLDVVQEPQIVVTVSSSKSISQSSVKRRKKRSTVRRKEGVPTTGRRVRRLHEMVCSEDALCSVKQVRVSVQRHLS